MKKILFGLFIIMCSCSKKVIHNLNLNLNEQNKTSASMNVDKKTTSEKFIIYHRFYCNYPVEMLESTEGIANEKAIEYEHNSILTSRTIGEYAMEPNTFNSHVNLAKYLEEHLNTAVTYFREDGTPQILWDFPAPAGITKENVKDITEITKFKKYHVINADEWGKGDYIVIFSNKMNFGVEGLIIDDFIFEDYASAEIGAIKLLLKASDQHSSKIDEYKTKTEQFSILLESLKYFKINAGYLIFESNINIDDVETFNEEERKEIKNEVDRIWSLIGYTPYKIKEF